MKKIIILLTVSLLMSCTPSHNDAKNKFNLPAELSDCTVISLLSSDAQNYTVFRCPLSNTTTVSNEKSKKNVTVSEYYPKQEKDNLDQQISEFTKQLSDEQKEQFLKILQKNQIN